MAFPFSVAERVDMDKVTAKLKRNIFVTFQQNGHKLLSGGARGVMVIIAGNGHGNTSSNPGRDWLHFT